MAVMLVIAAGLLIKSFWRLRSVDPGFQAEHVLTLELILSNKYTKPEATNQFFKQLDDSVSKLPGVQSVAIAYDHPLQTNWVDSFQIEGRVVATDAASLQANFNPVGPDYFKTLGMRLMSGRPFTAQDDQDHPGVAVVNESFVRQYFPNESPLGRRINPGPPGRIWKGQKLTSFEIIGVVHDVKSAGLQAPTEPTYYLPASQAPLQDMSVVVRTTTGPLAIIPELRQAVLAIDPDQPISNISTMEKIVSDSIARPRLNMFLMGLFGALALILASVGIYGLLKRSSPWC
jgi:putative ABC transport system permease protein